MKTITEFSSLTLKNAAKTQQELQAAGKTAEEMPAAMGEALKLEGDKLNMILAALEVIGTKTEDLKRVVVFALNEGEKAPGKAIQKGEHYYQSEFFPSLHKKSADQGQKPFEGRGGKGGRGGDRDKKKGRGGRRGDRRGPGDGAPREVGAAGEGRPEGKSGEGRRRDNRGAGGKGPRPPRTAVAPAGPSSVPPGGVIKKITPKAPAAESAPASAAETSPSSAPQNESEKNSS